VVALTGGERAICVAVAVRPFRRACVGEPIDAEMSGVAAGSCDPHRSADRPSPHQRSPNSVVPAVTGCPNSPGS
jgi:hypothetical protein